MNISRQSIGRRKGSGKGSATNVSTALSKAMRAGLSFLLFLAAALFVVSSNFLLRSKSNVPHHRDRSLRSAGPPSRAALPTPKNDEPAEFDSGEFRRKSVRPPSASVVLFYNLFIPGDAEGARHAVEVMTEQLGQVAASLRNPEGNERSAALFYNLIGNEHALTQESMAALCSELHPRFSCERIGFYRTASEAVTLQDVYSYCQQDAAADARVTYIHSKGSYHRTEVNTHWRRALTDAVVHPDCLVPPDDRCNVCGAQFYTRFATMFPGNMWTAKCSYVKSLLPPLEGGEYDRLKTESVVKFLKYRLFGTLDATLLEDRVDHYGLGRYRFEHWIGSHPSIRPCELHRQNVTLKNMIETDISPAQYEWGMGPRRHNATREFDKARERLESDEDARFREYFFLPGILLKWFTLYGSGGVPTQSHWAWDFFPAGDKWKELVGQYGENAVEAMATHSPNGFHSVSAFDHDETEEFQIEGEDEKFFSDTIAPLVVFYHIAVPAESKSRISALRTMKSQLEVLALGQYDIISGTHQRQRHVMLYYTITGNVADLGILTKICQVRSKYLTCRKLGESRSTSASGETLPHLHNFCRAKPSLSVTFLSNVLPKAYGVNKTEAYSLQKIRAYTTAVTSKMCLKPRDSCTVCGTEFFPLPYPHFLGNMFTASCDYVKELLPPAKFERATNDAADDALVSQLRRTFTTELFPFTPQNLGLGQYSVEHWIGSHPDFTPCDVAPVRHSWFPLSSEGSYLPNDYTSSRAYDFQWANAPRRSSAPAGRLSRKIEEDVRKKDDIIFREYYYLAGNLFRWFKIYGKAPSPDSWVWAWFPGGPKWQQGVEQHGADVVTKLSKPFWDKGVPF